jgi:dienelactone hydrolase
MLDSKTAPTTAVLDITPTDGLIDEPLTIRLGGLKPGQPATLRAHASDDAGGRWESAVTLAADAAGSVDLATARPVAGSYEVADAMGPIWSLRPVDDGAGPLDPFGTGLAPVTLHFEVEVDNRVAAAREVRRTWLAPGMARTEVRDRGLIGTLFRPAGAGPFPAVIVVGGSGGGLSEPFSALLASHGFIVLALAYFGIEPLPLDLIDIPLEYFETAIDWLMARPGVGGDGVGFVGTSRGGELVLLLGSRFPRIKAVVGYVPSFVVHGGIGRGEPDPRNPRPAWTHHGKPVTFLPPKGGRAAAEPTTPPPPGGIALTSNFLRMIEDEAAVEAATIPVEQIGGPILLVSGKDDQMWPSALFARRVMERLERMHFRHSFTHLSYANVGHRISAPFVPTTVNKSLHPVRRQVYAFGGTPAASAAARADSWPRVLEFLQRALVGAG